VGRRAEEREFTLENLELSERGWGEDRQELHCQSCGSDLSLSMEGSSSGEALSTTCPFCASNQVVARIATQEVLRPRFLIPFRLDAQDCVPLAREWLGRGWMHPKNLANAASSAQFQGLYLPFWTFDARIQANWKAEVGYPRTERYYDHGSKSWKTRTRIDWRWESGHTDLKLDDWLGIGTDKVSRVLQKRLYPFNIQDMVAYEPGFLAGWYAQSFNISLQDAWGQVKATMREHAKKACCRQIRSSHVRNFSMIADFADESWRYILLPVFIAAYRYQGEVFQVLVNGQTGKISGQKPIAWWKIWTAIALLLAPGFGLAMIGLPLLLLAGVGLLPLVGGGIMLIIGIALSIYIYRQAIKAGEV
jgi:hypothetical protein